MYMLIENIYYKRIKIKYQSFPSVLAYPYILAHQIHFHLE